MQFCFLLRRCIAHVSGALAIFNLVAFSSYGQVPFNSDSLPKATGQRIRYFTNSRTGILQGEPNEDEYVSIDSKYFTKSSQSQDWDFRIGPTNSIETISVLHADDLSDAFRLLYPKVTHALRFEDAILGNTSWEFYAKQGDKSRDFLGFKKGSDTPVAFEDENIDLPASITNGMQWSRSVHFSSAQAGFALATDFSATAVVDGFGTANLPNIGRLNVLRVHEVHEWDLAFLGSLLPLYYVNTYYWLAPGLGKVAEIIYPPSEAPDQIPPKAASFTRACKITDDIGRFSEVNQALIRRIGSQIEVSWPSEMDSFYVVRKATELTGESWNTVAVEDANTSSWPLNKENRSEFVRVFVVPKNEY